MGGHWRWLLACGWFIFLVARGLASPLDSLDREHWVSLDSTATDQVHGVQFARFVGRKTRSNLYNSSSPSPVSNVPPDGANAQELLWSAGGGGGAQTAAV